MLTLVSGSGGSGGSGAELSEFAGMVVRAVRQEAGSFGDCQLSQLLRYLLLLHRHQAHTGFHPYWWPDTSQQTQQLCARLLLQQHDALPPAALEPADGGGLSAGGVREHDVQASRIIAEPLLHLVCRLFVQLNSAISTLTAVWCCLQALRTSLGCDREEGVTLLRRARGSAFKALQDALQVGARAQPCIPGCQPAMSSLQGTPLRLWLAGQCVCVHATLPCPAGRPHR